MWIEVDTDASKQGLKDNSPHPMHMEDFFNNNNIKRP
jgi:hypothetical protein